MARKTKQVIIEADNRDTGKLFVVTEMAATAAERWASDAVHGLTRAGVDLPDNIAQAGTAAIASIGIKALGGTPPEVMHDLMDRLMNCVTYVPDPQRPEIARGANRPNMSPSTGPLFESDIEEVSTLLRLKAEVFTLQTGFSLADVKSLAARTAPALT